MPSQAIKNRQELVEWQVSFEKQYTMYVTDLFPPSGKNTNKILLFRKSLNGPRTIGVFDSPEEILKYLKEKPHC